MKNLKDISEIKNPISGELASRISGKNKSGTIRRIPVFFSPCKNCGRPRWLGVAHQKMWAKRGGRQDFCYRCSTVLKNSMDKHSNWKGGCGVHNGYIYVHLPKDHPFYGMTNSSHTIAVHRLIMAEKLGRFLKPDEFVHHINEKRMDNRPENLELTTNKDHCRIHKPEARR